MTTEPEARGSRWRAVLAAGIVLVAILAPVSARGADAWVWSVVGPVLRGFDPPMTAFGSGHRGIDIACRPGSPIGSARSGIVSFAGSVGGQRYVTITHGDGVQTTASWVDRVLVRKDDAVMAGEPIATCGVGHTGSLIPHVHLGVRAPDGTYLDPLRVLPPPRLTSFLRLVPR